MRKGRGFTEAQKAFEKKGSMTFWSSESGWMSLFNHLEFAYQKSSWNQSSLWIEGFFPPLTWIPLIVPSRIQFDNLQATHATSLSPPTSLLSLPSLTHLKPKICAASFLSIFCWNPPLTHFPPGAATALFPERIALAANPLFQDRKREHQDIKNRISFYSFLISRTSWRDGREREK